jgi:hypothetical protein
MNDSEIVRSLERFRDLPGDWERFIKPQSAVSDPIGKRGSFNQLENKRSNPARFLDSVDVRDVGMIQRSQHMRLALEAGHALRIGRKGVRQYFDSDVAMEFPVAGAINLTHAAGTERGEDFVRSKRVAGNERHAVPTAGGVIVVASTPGQRPSSASGHPSIDQNWRRKIAVST